ncbi:MAG: hypothetical protein J6M30_06330 [Bacteroidales bacterium]|nr:hypothetical protein [Bacteroidales bacterium]
MKKFKFKHLLYLAVMVFGTFTFTSCSDDNDEDGNVIESEVLQYDFVYLNNLYKMSSVQDITDKLTKDGFTDVHYDTLDNYVKGSKTINYIPYSCAVQPHIYAYIEIGLPKAIISMNTLKSLLDAIFNSENKIAGENPKYRFSIIENSDDDNIGTDKNEGIQKIMKFCMDRNSYINASLEFEYNSFHTRVGFYHDEYIRMEIGTND